MSDELNADEVEVLKSRFRDAGCEVRDLEDTEFEIVGKEFKVRTHVLVTPYFVQLGTFLFVRPGGLLPSRKSRIHEFLSESNSRAKLVKFTLEADGPQPARGGWPVMASVKLVTGVTGGDYHPAALKNLVLLWYQDLAELVASPGDFEVHAMMDETAENP